MISASECLAGKKNNKKTNRERCGTCPKQEQTNEKNAKIPYITDHLRCDRLLHDDGKRQL